MASFGAKVLKSRMRRARRACGQHAKLTGNGLKVSDEEVMKGLKADAKDDSALQDEERRREAQYWKDRSAQLDYELYISAMNGNRLHAEFCRVVLCGRIPEPPREYQQHQQHLHESETAATAVEPHTPEHVASLSGTSTSSEPPSLSGSSSSDSDSTFQPSTPTSNETSYKVSYR